MQINAQQKGTAQSWIIEASPAAFSGTEPITAYDGYAPFKGVTVIFPLTENDNVGHSAEIAARFCPLAITINDELVEREDFLADAILIEEWKGIRIGVFKSTHHHHLGHGNNVNFHGVTLRAGLPQLHQQFHQSFYAKIDVTCCSDLKLVLPARKEIVRDDFFQELRSAIMMMFYGMMARRSHHSLSYEDYSEGRSLGIRLKEAEPCLRPFTPRNADFYHNKNSLLEQVGADAYLITSPDSPIADQNFARALGHQSTNIKFFGPCEAFTGYRWYDALICAAVSGYRISIEDQTQEISLEDRFTLEGQPDQIQVLLEYNKSNTVHHLAFDTDLLIIGDDYDGIDDVDVYLAKSSEASPDDLAELLQAALFSFSDACEAGSYDQQLEWFRDDAEDFAVALLRSGADAELGAVIRVIERNLLCHLPNDRRVLIDITGSEVVVRGLEAAASPPLEEISVAGGNS